MMKLDAGFSYPGLEKFPESLIQNLGNVVAKLQGYYSQDPNINIGKGVYNNQPCIVVTGESGTPNLENMLPDKVGDLNKVDELKDIIGDIPKEISDVVIGYRLKSTAYIQSSNPHSPIPPPFKRVL